jgi:hypothetical protein
VPVAVVFEAARFVGAVGACVSPATAVIVIPSIKAVRPEGPLVDPYTRIVGVVDVAVTVKLYNCQVVVLIAVSVNPVRLTQSLNAELLLLVPLLPQMVML